VSTRRPVRAAASGLCLLAMLASSDRSRPAEAAAPPATGRAATAIGTCDGRQLGEWQFVAREQMRVQARGRSGNDWVGLTAATDGFHDWAPFDDFKTTICGALGIFGTFEPTREKEFLRFLPEIPEHDWNVILIPTARSIFDERFRLARRLMERGHEGDLVSCQGTPCFEAEVTPQSRLLKANSAGGWLTSCRRGQTLCTFGPWVGDGGHGYRPEIHPAERIWWRDGDRLKLIAVQDASQRFRDHRQFQWADTREPSRWHPWAAPSMQGEFRVAFEAAAGSAVEFLVEQMLDTNVRGVTPPVPAADMQYAFSHQGTDVGGVRVRLGLGATSERLELNLSSLDIAPDDVCLRPDGRSLQDTCACMTSSATVTRKARGSTRSRWCLRRCSRRYPRRPSFPARPVRRPRETTPTKRSTWPCSSSRARSAWIRPRPCPRPCSRTSCARPRRSRVSNRPWPAPRARRSRPPTS